jgi:hypothetical protein
MFRYCKAHHEAGVQEWIRALEIWKAVVMYWSYANTWYGVTYWVLYIGEKNLDYIYSTMIEPAVG